MLLHYIYLVQEREFRKTEENIYKVGRTTQEDFSRIKKGYPNGSSPKIYTECINSIVLERQIIKLFKQQFKRRKDIGNEYFEGDWHIMVKIILETIENERLNYDKDGNLIYEKILNVFPDYENDESFGGKKKYIKIIKDNDNYIVQYINPKIKSYIEYCYENEIEIDVNVMIQTYILCKNATDKLQYFDNLISKNKIQFDKIYDINSNNFIKRINKTKKNIKIENHYSGKSQLLKSIMGKTTEGIRQLFNCNIIINEVLYATILTTTDKPYDTMFKKLKDFDSFSIDMGLYKHNFIDVYKINKKYYYKTLLIGYLPHIIRWNSNYNYYNFVNRNNSYNELNRNYIKYDREIHLFDDKNHPLSNKSNYIEYRNMYKKIIEYNSLKECFNMNPYIKTILTLF